VRLRRAKITVFSMATTTVANRRSHQFALFVRRTPVNERNGDFSPTTVVQHDKFRFQPQPCVTTALRLYSLPNLIAHAAERVMANTLPLVALLVLSSIAFAQSSGAIAPPYTPLQER
jgi:hypothetical protein